MFAEEGDGAGLRQRRIGGAVAATLITAEAMLGAGIDIDGDAGLGCADFFHVAHRNARVFFAEMQLHRAVRHFGCGAGNAAAARGRRRRATGHRPAPAAGARRC